MIGLDLGIHRQPIVVSCPCSNLRNVLHEATISLGQLVVLDLTLLYMLNLLLHLANHLLCMHLEVASLDMKVLLLLHHLHLLELLQLQFLVLHELHVDLLLHYYLLLFKLFSDVLVVRSVGLLIKVLLVHYNLLLFIIVLAHLDLGIILLLLVD